MNKAHHVPIYEKSPRLKRFLKKEKIMDFKEEPKTRHPSAVMECYKSIYGNEGRLERLPEDYSPKKANTLSTTPYTEEMYFESKFPTKLPLSNIPVRKPTVKEEINAEINYVRSYNKLPPMKYLDYGPPPKGPDEFRKLDQEVKDILKKMNEKSMNLTKSPYKPSYISPRAKNVRSPRSPKSPRGTFDLADFNNSFSRPI